MMTAILKRKTTIKVSTGMKVCQLSENACRDRKDERHGTILV